MEKRQTLVMTFGTFDIFHPGHEYYLSQARKLWDRLITVIARDSTVFKIKGKIPRENEETRLLNVQRSGIVSQAVFGSKESPFDIVAEYKPDILCFGYDQRSFNDERLEKFLTEHNLHPKIVIIPPFEPERWKSSKL